MALSASVGALAMIGAFAAAIVVSRLRLNYRLSLERAVAERWNPLLAQCAESVPAALPRLRPRERQTFLILWCRAQEALRGDAQDNLRELARRMGIETLVGELLTSREPRLQLLAVLCAGHLGSREAIPRLLDLIREAGSIVSLTAGRALMRIDPAIAMPHVLEATAARDDWSLARIVAAFAECDPAEVARALAPAIRTQLYKERMGIRAGGVARLLPLHVAAHESAIRETVLLVLAEAESTSALVAALAALSHPEDVEHARRLLGHRHWPLREAAASALGRLGTADDLARLAGALGDRQRWVRYRAARSLCRLVSAAKLEALLLDGLEDRYAVDTLRQALAERATT